MSAFQFKQPQPSRLILALLAAWPAAHAQSPDTVAELPMVNIQAKRELPLPTPLNTNADWQPLKASTIDSASLLSNVPGVSLYGAGGFSSLPALHGLADDRVRIQVDGMDAIAACPNHMNPALSYLAPNQVAKLAVYAGIAPVSLGGDSIAGTIVAETAEAQFAPAGTGLLKQGEIGTEYRSNGNAQSMQASATLASETFSLNYSGNRAKSGNYHAGADFKTYTASARPDHELRLDEVGSTAYEVENHLVTMAWHTGQHLLEAKMGVQNAPYSLFPNQRMDMLGNDQSRLSLRYEGQYDWGRLEVRAYQETVDHFMDFGPDKQYRYGTLTSLNDPSVIYQVNGMPMYTHATTRGLSLQGEFDLNERDLLRVGGQLQSYRLDDWWPPAPDCGVGNCIGGMAPLTFWNIRDGQRDRKALFGEWDAKWNPQWTSQIGLRAEQVTSNSGRVNGYTSNEIAGANGMTMMGMRFGDLYAGSSVIGGIDAFNAMNRKRTDLNWDFSAISRYRPSDAYTLEFGYAQKTRSPNLYERYSWSSNGMAMEMNNFVGDGNAYVGNPDLKPEVAHTLSATADWHDPQGGWGFRATPFYSRVSDYIDAVRSYPGSTASNAALTNGFVRLQYANQTARLQGLDLSGHMILGSNDAGQWGLRGLLNVTHGTNSDTGSALYNIMPTNARLTLTHQIGGWDNALEWVGVQGKSQGSEVRNEIHTPGYSLLNLRTSYRWSRVRIDFGIENLLNRLYYLPLGGAYTGQGSTMALNREINGSSSWGTAVPGAGRTFYTGVNVKF